MATVADDPPDDPNIPGASKIIRRVVPGRFMRMTGQPEASAFRRKGGDRGLSVTLWATQADLDATLSGNAGFGVLGLYVHEVRAEGLSIAFTEVPGNPNHCELFGDLPGRVQQRLAITSRWVVYPADYPEDLKRPLWELHQA